MEKLLVNIDKYKVFNCIPLVRDENVAEYVVVTDMTAEFDRIFCRQVYNNFAEIKELLRQFEQVCVIFIQMHCAADNGKCSCA